MSVFCSVPCIINGKVSLSQRTKFTFWRTVPRFLQPDPDIWTSQLSTEFEFLTKPTMSFQWLIILFGNITFSLVSLFTFFTIPRGSWAMSRLRTPKLLAALEMWADQRLVYHYHCFLIFSSRVSCCPTNHPVGLTDTLFEMDAPFKVLCNSNSPALSL